MAVYQSQTTGPRLGNIQRIALIIGAVALAASVLGAFVSTTQQFFQSYLYAYLFWFGLSLGSLALLLLQNLVGGRWGLAIKRLLEAGAANLPMMALLFVPIILGMTSLYPWARPEDVAANEFIEHRTPYLNAPFFILRAVLFFAIWIGLAFLLRRWSIEQDRTGDPALTRRMRMLSGLGIVLYVLTMTFAAVDWAMSVEPIWFSTIYGVIFIVGQGLSTFSLMAITLALLRRTEPLSAIASPGRFHDIGSLMFAFTVLWAYVNFSQFLIIYSANLVEEASWYVYRSEGGWQYLAILLMIGQFALPFFLLLSRKTKRSPQLLPIVAGGILLLRLVDLFWVLKPSFNPEQIQVHWLDVVSVIGLGGLWLGAFAWWLQRRPLVARNDPRMPDMFEHGHDNRHGESPTTAHT